MQCSDTEYKQMCAQRRLCAHDNSLWNGSYLMCLWPIEDTRN